MYPELECIAEDQELLDEHERIHPLIAGMNVFLRQFSITRLE